VRSIGSIIAHKGRRGKTRQGYIIYFVEGYEHGEGNRKTAEWLKSCVPAVNAKKKLMI
jgi:hypothetical protein